MFGFKIIKDEEYNRMKKEIEGLIKQLREKVKCNECNEAFCSRCIHYKSYIKYIDEYPFMILIKYCDLKCECKNFEEIKCKHISYMED